MCFNMSQSEFDKFYAGSAIFGRFGLILKGSTALPACLPWIPAFKVILDGCSEVRGAHGIDQSQFMALILPLDQLCGVHLVTLGLPSKVHILPVQRIRCLGSERHHWGSLALFWVNLTLSNAGTKSAADALTTYILVATSSMHLE